MAAKKRKNNPRRGRRGQQQQPPQQPPSPPAITPPILGQANPPVDGGDGSGYNSAQLPRPDGSINWEWWFAAAIAAATIVQAFFGSRQWLTTERQYDAMKEQNEITQRQLGHAEKTLAMMQLEQRPWISIDDPHIEGLEEEGMLPILVLTLVNSGKLPGTTKDMLFSVTIEDGDPSIIGKIPGFTETLVNSPMNTSIPPNGKIRHVVDQLEPLTEELLQDIRTEKKRICLLGIIKYRGPDDAETFKTDFAGYFDAQAEKLWLHYNEME